VRIILSFNPREAALAEAFRATLFVHAPDLEVFFSPPMLEEHRSLPLCNADGILLFVGAWGLGEFQNREFRLAQRRQQELKGFKVVPIIAAGGGVPSDLGPNLSWVSAPIVTDAGVAHQVIDALLGGRDGQALLTTKGIPPWERLGRHSA
jgi:hypothetical protein